MIDNIEYIIEGLKLALQSRRDTGNRLQFYLPHDADFQVGHQTPHDFNEYDRWIDELFENHNSETPEEDVYYVVGIPSTDILSNIYNRDEESEVHGEVNGSDVVVTGQDITLTAIDGPNAVFSHWTKVDDVDFISYERSLKIKDVRDNAIYIAHFTNTTQTFKLIFDANGGSFEDGQTTKTFTIYKDDQFEIPEELKNPTLTGYTFQGKYIGSNNVLLSVSEGGVYEPIRSVYFKALWTKNEEESGSGSGGSGSDTEIIGTPEEDEEGGYTYPSIPVDGDGNPIVTPPEGDDETGGTVIWRPKDDPEAEPGLPGDKLPEGVDPETPFVGTLGYNVLFVVEPENAGKVTCSSCSYPEPLVKIGDIAYYEAGSVIQASATVYDSNGYEFEKWEDENINQKREFIVSNDPTKNKHTANFKAKSNNNGGKGGDSILTVHIQDKQSGETITVQGEGDITDKQVIYRNAGENVVFKFTTYGNRVVYYSFSEDGDKDLVEGDTLEHKIVKSEEHIYFEFSNPRSSSGSTRSNIRFVKEGLSEDDSNSVSLNMIFDDFIDTDYDYFEDDELSLLIGEQLAFMLTASSDYTYEWSVEDGDAEIVENGGRIIVTAGYEDSTIKCSFTKLPVVHRVTVILTPNYGSVVFSDSNSDAIIATAGEQYEINVVPKENCRVSNVITSMKGVVTGSNNSYMYTAPETTNDVVVTFVMEAIEKPKIEITDGSLTGNIVTITTKSNCKYPYGIDNQYVKCWIKDSTMKPRTVNISNNEDNEAIFDNLKVATYVFKAYMSVFGSDVLYESDEYELTLTAENKPRIIKVTSSSSIFGQAYVGINNTQVEQYSGDVALRAVENRGYDNTFINWEVVKGKGTIINDSLINSAYHISDDDELEILIKANFGRNNIWYIRAGQPSDMGISSSVYVKQEAESVAVISLNEYNSVFYASTNSFSKTKIFDHWRIYYIRNGSEVEVPFMDSTTNNSGTYISSIIITESTPSGTTLYVEPVWVEQITEYTIHILNNRSSMSYVSVGSSQGVIEYKTTNPNERINVQAITRKEYSDNISFQKWETDGCTIDNISSPISVISNLTKVDSFIKAYWYDNEISVPKPGEPVQPDDPSENPNPNPPSSGTGSGSGSSTGGCNCNHTVIINTGSSTGGKCCCGGGSGSGSGSSNLGTTSVGINGETVEVANNFGIDVNYDDVFKWEETEGSDFGDVVQNPTIEKVDLDEILGNNNSNTGGGCCCCKNNQQTQPTPPTDNTNLNTTTIDVNGELISVLNNEGEDKEYDNIFGWDIDDDEDSNLF